MGRQEELISINNSIDSKDFKFYLSNAVYGTLLLIHAPDGYTEDEFSFSRDMKTFGVFLKFAENEIKFLKEGRDYVQQCYEAFSTNADVKLTVWKFNKNTLQYELRFEGVLDFSTYKISEISADIQVIDGSFTAEILNRESVKVNLMGTKSINGTEIGDPNISLIQVPQVNIIQIATWGLKDNNDYTSGHVIPVKLLSSEFLEAATPIDNLIPSNNIDAALFKNAIEEYVDAGIMITGKIIGVVKYVSNQGDVSLSWRIDKYSLEGTFIENSFIHEIIIYTNDPGNESVFEINVNFTEPLLIGEYLIFSCKSDSQSFADYFIFNYSKADLIFQRFELFISPRIIIGINYHDAFERIVNHYTGLKGKVYSEFFGRTDLGYSTDGKLGAITPGRFIRQLSGTNGTLTTSLKDLFESLSLYCIGMGVENGLLRIESMDYFFQSNIILNLSDRIETETIVKEVIPDLLSNSLVMGYSSFDAEELGGNYEYNASSTWTTILKIINSFNLKIPYQAGMINILKLLNDLDLSKSVKGDEDIFLLDLVREPEAYTADYKLRTNEGFDSIIGGVNAEENFNLLLTPARIVRYWGRYIRAMLDRWKLSKIQWQTSDKSTLLKTTVTGEAEVVESDDIVVGSLNTPLWHPEKYIVNAYLSNEEFRQLQANPKGLIKLADDKFGWILSAKCNNSSKEIKLQILRANLSYITPKFVQNGYLYNWFALFDRSFSVKYGLLYNWYAATDERLICADGWEVSNYTQWTDMITYLGGASIAGGKLKELGLDYWLTPNTGATNEVSFNGRGSGYRNTSGVFSLLKNTSQILTSTLAGSSPRCFVLNYALETIPINNVTDSKAGNSIRIIKTTTTLTHGQTGTYTGNDGKVYRTICIGTQEWLADNLAETKFRNGDYIPGYDAGVYTPISNAAWAALTSAACCAYADNLTNVFLITLISRLTPPGWHVPTRAELTALYYDHLDNPEKFNFTGLGVRLGDGDYTENPLPTLWSSEEHDINNAYSQSDDSAFYDKNAGFSVRLFKDAPETWTEGDVLTIEGVEYRTAQLTDGSVCMIDSLRVTKYNDGTPIEKINGNNSAWAANTGGAYCAWNDDETTV